MISSYYKVIPFPRKEVKSINRLLDDISSFFSNIEESYKFCPIYLTINRREVNPIYYRDIIDRYCSESSAKMIISGDYIYITTILETIIKNNWHADLQYISDNVEKHGLLITYIMFFPIIKCGDIFLFNNIKIKETEEGSLFLFITGGKQFLDYVTISMFSNQEHIEDFIYE